MPQTSKEKSHTSRRYPGDDSTPTVVLSYPRDHPFVHIVCHGILELGKLGSDLRHSSNFHDTEGLFLEGDQVV